MKAKLTPQDIADYNALPLKERIKAWESYQRLVELGELEPFEGLIEKPSETKRSTMHKEILPEYLGQIDSELILQNLTNTNEKVNTIDFQRELIAGRKFEVIAEFEHQWRGDPQTVPPIAKRFVGLRLEPPVDVSQTETMVKDPTDR